MSAIFQSRTRRFVESLITGYGATGVTVLYSLISVPMALSFLGTEKFGLWALVFQASTYLAMGDLGVSSAIGRLMMPCVGNRPQKVYGQIFFAGLLSFLAQACVLFFIGFFLAWFGPKFFSIPVELAGEFFWLMVFQAIIICIFFPFKCITFAFIAHAKYNWINISGAVGLSTALITLTICFYSGLGIYSFPIATASEALVTSSVLIWSAKHYNILPKKSEWHLPDLKQVSTVWSVGRDFFLSSIGLKILFSSQAFLLAKFSGLEAVTVWVVGSKMFFFIRDLIGKATQMAGPILTELYLKKMYSQLGARTSQLAQGFLFLGGVLAGCLILLNPIFVFAWTNGKVLWPSFSDIFLAILIITGAITNLLGHSIYMTLNFKKFRWISIQEAILFLILSIITIPLWGINGMLASHVICTLLISTRFVIMYYSSFRIQNNIQSPISFGVLLKILSLLAFASLLSMGTEFLKFSLEFLILTTLLFIIISFVISYNFLKQIYNAMLLKV